MLKHMLGHMPQASCKNGGQAMPYERTNVQTTELLTLGSYVSLVIARRGAAESSPEVGKKSPPGWPKVGERWPVRRTSGTETRQEISSQDRIFVLARDGFRCQYCACGGLLALDHVVPWSAGGSDHVDNLRTLCLSCNESRSNYCTARDVEWRPLPATYECVRCNPDLPRADPAVGIAFCYWHRTRALGVLDLRRQAIVACPFCYDNGFTRDGYLLCTHNQGVTA